MNRITRQIDGIARHILHGVNHVLSGLSQFIAHAARNTRNACNRTTRQVRCTTCNAFDHFRSALENVTHHADCIARDVFDGVNGIVRKVNRITRHVFHSINHALCDSAVFTTCTGGGTCKPSCTCHCARDRR